MANEAALLTADIRRDATMLDSLIADDFLEFGASGAAFGKSEVMERLPTEESPVIQAQDFQARQLGEGVVQITYKSVRDPASSAPRHALRSSIWRCRDGRWQMVFHQGTVTEPFAVG
ncbi:nuclear transport factor 2 family protein [Chromobacterium paludis]|nr:nuclear transport factor 2 family protein [Chromobacterium paludis]